MTYWIVMRAVALLLITATVATACIGGGIYSREAAQRTWNKAWMVVPKGAAPERFSGRRNDPAFQAKFNRWQASETGGRKIPVAILMHNCAGGGLDVFEELFGEFGVVTVQPRSFARGRKSNCGGGSPRDGSTTTAGRVPGTYDMRVQEVDIALAAVRNWTWVDQSKLFLAGQSEGGWITTGYSSSGFAGRIAVGNGCNAGIGIRGDERILIINGSSDAWLTNYGHHCPRHARFKSNVREIMVANGGHHELRARNPEAIQAARDLIRDILSR